MRKQKPMSILPPGMEGRTHNGTLEDSEDLKDWQASDMESLLRGSERTSEPGPLPHNARPIVHRTIRAVTPDQGSRGDDEPNSPMDHPSPRSIPGGEKSRDRRAGLVFEESYSTESLERKHASPPVAFQSRPRNRTLDESQRQRSTSTSVSRSRHRIGSVHSTSATSFHDVEPRSLPDTSTSMGFSSMSNRPPVSLAKQNSMKGGRKLVKRGSRPTSPLQVMVDVPSVDSLPFPVATEDASKILKLMKTLYGRMRGEAEYQIVESGAWYSGLCYIDDLKGSLMYEAEDQGPFHATIVSDLRGCRIRPLDSALRHKKCLEITNRSLGIEILLLPSVKEEYDSWLAALLCWQQVRNGILSPSPSRTGERRLGPQRRNSSFSSLSAANTHKTTNIIKVAKLLLWDKGAPSSPKAIVRRPSTRDLRSPTQSSWRKVSCILQDNGEFKLLTENDVTLLSVIQLSQLSRCAIQRLNRSVLEEEYCVAIFPQYSSTSTQLSIFRPVYIAMESRLAYEVWFCLLRAFTIPEIYGPSSDEDENNEITEVSSAMASNNMFRLEKSLSLRVVEAKIRKTVSRPVTHHGKHSSKPDSDPSIGDYFAEVVLDGELRAKTNTKTDTRNPFWREDAEFQDLPSHMPKLSIVIKRLESLETASHGFLSSSTFQDADLRTDVVCGTVNVPIETVEKGKDSETWWPILDENHETVGELFLKFRHDEIVVLLAKEYQEISELLHKFSSGLTVQIAQAIPSQLRQLSEILMNIFQVSGHSAEWLMALVEEEIDGVGKETPVRRVRWSRRIGSNESFGSVSDREQAVRDMGKSLQGEANLLFRGNSLLTQALDFHMRRLGKEYLEEVLSQKIEEINALNSDCEVDPSRIAHGEDVNKNWALLKSLTTGVWQSISGSAERCPSELRQILKYIRAVAEDRYGDFLRTVAYTSVSGFLFLRFFCPALLNPKLFGLLRDHPRPKAQRALTLVAKSLQALANLSTFGAKEAWMEPMNRFLSGHRQEVKKYIDDVCAIPAERNTFALPASYSTPITILARLPPTFREGFPSLPFLIDHARNFASLVKLWLEATARYSPPSGLEGDFLKFTQICVELQQRTDDCLLKAEQGDRSADQLSLQWEDVVDSHEASTIQAGASKGGPEPLSELYDPPWAEYTASIVGGQRNAPSSAGSEFIGKERKDRQSFWEATFGKEIKSQRSGDLTSPAPSPPNRNQSKTEKSSRTFLGGFRRKGKDGKADANSPLNGGSENTEQ